MVAPERPPSDAAVMGASQNPRVAGRSNMTAGGASKSRDQQHPSPPQEAFHRRTTFYVNGEWSANEDPNAPAYITGQMYVEHLEPVHKMEESPIILIHDDFHTGQSFLTKPDGNPGWASFFLNRGYNVYIPDLPYVGRSNYLTPNLLRSVDLAKQAQFMNAQVIEREVTCPERLNRQGWRRAVLHNKFPGTGQRGDPIFDNYASSLVPMIPQKAERETLVQNGLRALLERTGKAILIGVGAGAIAAWLTADIQPESVQYVVAVEPSGPPFGIAYRDEGEHRVYMTHVVEANIRPYGLSEIPLTFNPPARERGCFSDAKPLDTELCYHRDLNGSVLRQIGLGGVNALPDWLAGPKVVNGPPPKNVRQLIQLMKMRHLMITSQASSHTSYDWQTYIFLKDAGVDVSWMRPETSRVCGNGHLMFLETNSDAIAYMIHQWIKMEARLQTRSITPTTQAPTTGPNGSAPSTFPPPPTSRQGDAAGGGSPQTHRPNGNGNCRTWVQSNRNEAANRDAKAQQSEQREQGEETEQRDATTQPSVDVDVQAHVKREEHLYKKRKMLSSNPLQYSSILEGLGNANLPQPYDPNGKLDLNTAPFISVSTAYPAIIANTNSPAAEGNPAFTKSDLPSATQGIAYDNSFMASSHPAITHSNMANTNPGTPTVTNVTYLEGPHGNTTHNWVLSGYQANSFLNHGVPNGASALINNGISVQSSDFQVRQGGVQYPSPFQGNPVSTINMGSNGVVGLATDNQTAPDTPMTNVGAPFYQIPEYTSNDGAAVATLQFQQGAIYPSPSSFRGGDSIEDSGGSGTIAAG